MNVPEWMKVPVGKAKNELKKDDEGFHLETERATETKPMEIFSLSLLSVTFLETEKERERQNQWNFFLPHKQGCSLWFNVFLSEQCV